MVLEGGQYEMGSRIQRICVERVIGGSAGWRYYPGNLRSNSE